MDRSNSVSSTSSSSSSRATSSVEPFAYQTRILERTLSLSRTNSISKATGNLGPSSSASGSRRWDRTHRVGGSIDAVRGKWEELSRSDSTTNNQTVSPTKALFGSEKQPPPSPSPSIRDNIIPTREDTGDGGRRERTYSPSKRYTLPAPIIASPLSPNTTGISVVSPEPTFHSSANRIRLPTTNSPSVSSVRRLYDNVDQAVVEEPTKSSPPPPSRSRRSIDFDSIMKESKSEPSDPPWKTPNLRPTRSQSSQDGSGTPVKPRPSSMYSTSQYSIPSSPLKLSRQDSITAKVFGEKRSSSPMRMERRNSESTSTTRVTSSIDKLNKLSSISRRDPSPERPAQLSSITNSVHHRSASPDKLYRQNSTSSSLASSSLDVGSSKLSTPSYRPPPSSPSAFANQNVESVMYPTPYRSSYVAKKKGGSYGDGLSVGRRLGRHLPRIASGDGNDDPEPERKPPPSPVQERYEKELTSDFSRMSRLERREKRMREWQLELEREKPPTVPPKDRSRSIDSDRTLVTHPGEDVAGIPGRLRLSKDVAAPTSPMGPTTPIPSSRIRSVGLWADTQRHLLRAYEYLCHVGEAQQWIEGCLGEELGFGVVEMEESLRNGVVLARLARVFLGEDVVRRIFESSKPDLRQTDNINHFFTFVKSVALPECFIFETTDLYNKKNIPKVIYCIHALSHLLARRGLAQRIGNLLGQLKFSDDQLQKTEKGLNDAGVPMPNFGNIGRELTKEMNEEPEEEPETEDERRDRLLLENEESIIAVQSLSRAFMERRAQKTKRARIDLAERYVAKLQARCRGLITRAYVRVEKQAQTDAVPSVVSLQAQIRGFLAKRRQRQQAARLRTLRLSIVKIQAQSRGAIQRRRYALLRVALTKGKMTIMKIQAAARAKLVKKSHQQIQKALIRPTTMTGVKVLQASARAFTARRAYQAHLQSVKQVSLNVVSLQAQLRGVLARHHARAQMAKLDDLSGAITRIQAAARCYLARKRLLNLIRALRRATTAIVAVQALSRTRLQQQRFNSMTKAMGEIKVIKSVGTLQSFARAALARKRNVEQAKELHFVEPDVVGLQAAVRGALSRCRFFAWRDYLHDSEPEVIHLQSLLRGALERRRFETKMRYYKENLHKVVKIQSLFRAKDTRDQYRQLTLGHNVNVGTIKNFVHLLDDSEADFEDEIEVERLRKRVVQGIRETQALETEVNELDVKIALVVQNVKSFEELIRARRRHGTDTAAAHASRASILAAHGDPFAGPNTLDHATKRKLELYQQLFYLLQSQGEYLSKLFSSLEKREPQDKDRKLVERVVLTLFGYGQDQREDYLFFKLLQLAIRGEISTSPSPSTIMQDSPMYLNVALQYGRSKQALYVRETLMAIINDVANQEDLDLETDPCVIYRSRINTEEMRSGMKSSKPKDVAYKQAVEDPETRKEFIHHLQFLHAYVKTFVNAIIASTKFIPYNLRLIARETHVALKAKFPSDGDDAYALTIGRLLFYHYINPAIVAPETFDLVPSTINFSARKNLNEISRVLLQISSGTQFGDDNPSLTPLNPYVAEAIKEMRVWFLEVANVPDAEAHYHAHEFLDAAFQPKPIYISPNEVYSMHSLLAQNIERLAPSRDDPLRHILLELGGAPNLVPDELNSTWDNAITLELTNRFASVNDPHAEEKALWVQGKRAVLAILRVQPAKDLVECLMQPVSEEHEMFWEDIVDRELMNDHMRQRQRRMPSTTGAESAYRLDDIKSLSFKEVKAHAIYFLLELEKQGKVTREDGYQGILNAIAGDVRSKHRKRLQRQQELESMTKTLKHLAERKRFYEEQIKSYNNYVEAAMNTMQKSKKKKSFLFVPFTRQFFHWRDLLKSGRAPQFGSYRYSASELYDKGILLSIEQYSPRQFNRIDVVLSSDVAGVFNVELYSSVTGSSTLIGETAVRMEDLLQAQFENRVALTLLDGVAKFNLNLLLYQINKKFYV
ncbi:hypothetical protein SCHPADRAFT_902188 [Schizopora paradoxa]|uniref:Ras GTPase-activating protein n=1 Tax=Schizopora paradoxa TaxID=27342 RepID=A0A0H2SF34_9AGAM|nr:hypothetical protein SCHPADRAFT_902188 [Schizopora paradoxa]